MPRGVTVSTRVFEAQSIGSNPVGATSNNMNDDQVLDILCPSIHTSTVDDGFNEWFESLTPEERQEYVDAMMAD